MFLPTGVITVMSRRLRRRGPRPAAKPPRPAKKAGKAKKATSKPKADRTNKKAEVIAMMKRAKGATLPEIMKSTGWQPHTVRGFRQHPGQQREARRSSRPRTPRASGRTDELGDETPKRLSFRSGYP
jgi:hypothetical protein